MKHLRSMNRRGFTLVELLVVIAIIGSSPILVPGFEKRRNSLSFGDERINHRTLPSFIRS